MTVEIFTYTKLISNDAKREKIQDNFNSLFVSPKIAIMHHKLKNDVH